MTRNSFMLRCGRKAWRFFELRGICPGEHGVGIGKRNFMELEHSQSYELLRIIKKLVDPKGLINPDNIFF